MIQCSVCDGTYIDCVECGSAAKRVYAIGPLKWEVWTERGDYRACSPFGTYYVDYLEDGTFQWWQYTGRESDPECYPCTSIEDGKAKAQAHYEEWLKKCLKEVKR